MESGFTEAINRDLIFQFVFNGNWKEIGRKKLRKLERNWKIIGGSRFTVYMCTLYIHVCSMYVHYYNVLLYNMYVLQITVVGIRDLGGDN